MSVHRSRSVVLDRGNTDAPTAVLVERRLALTVEHVVEVTRVPPPLL
jgi:hypothetical protein